MRCSLIALVVVFVLPTAPLAYSQVLGARRIGVEYSEEKPPLETTGPFAEEAKGIPPELAEIDRLCKVVVYYFIPTDREPAEGYQERITLLMRFANSYFSDAEQTWYPLEEGESANQRGLSFVFDPDKPDQLYVKLIRGRHAARYYNNLSAVQSPSFEHMQAHGARIWSEAQPHHLRERRQDKSLRGICLLPFVYSETYELDEKGRPDNRSGVTVGYPVVTSEALTFSSALTVEEYVDLFKDNPAVLSHTWAVAHEIGHALGLPHIVPSSDYHIMSEAAGTGIQNFLPDNRFATDQPKVRFSSQSIARLKHSRWLRGRPQANKRFSLKPQSIE